MRPKDNFYFNKMHLVCTGNQFTLSSTNKNGLTQRPGYLASITLIGLHDVIVRVVEHRVLGGDVCSHVVGER